MADGEPALQPILGAVTDIAIPVIALGEFSYGIRQSRHRSRYEHWLAELLSSSTILSVNEDTAGEYAVVREELKRNGRPIPSNDVWIAALARQHSLPLLSRDVHFDLVPKLKRLSW